MVLDGCHHESRGDYGFENEQGYMAGMLNGFGRRLESVRDREPLETRLVEVLHDTCIDGVHSKPLIQPELEGSARDGRMTRGYRTDDGSNVGVGFGFKPVRMEGDRRVGTTTPEGLGELETERHGCPASRAMFQRDRRRTTVIWRGLRCPGPDCADAGRCLRSRPFSLPEPAWPVTRST